MSPYRAGWGALVGFHALLLAWLASAAAFVPRDALGLFFSLSLLLWLPVMVTLAIIPRCPKCRTSVFTAYKGRWGAVARPWPSRRCRVCSAELDR